MLTVDSAKIIDGKICIDICVSSNEEIDEFIDDIKQVIREMTDVDTVTEVKISYKFSPLVN